MSDTDKSQQRDDHEPTAHGQSDLFQTADDSDSSPGTPGGDGAGAVADDSGDAATLPWEDAGEGAEAQEAEAKTQRHFLKLAENRVSGDEAIAQVRAQETDLVRRAAALVRLEAFKFPELRVVNGGMGMTQPANSDTNRYAVFEGLFGSGEDRPHIDTFSGRIVDHTRRVFDEWYSMVEFVNAFRVAGMPGQSADALRKAFKEWAMMRRQNDLMLRFERKLPEWDGVPRIESFLVKFFDSFDTKLNREFGAYFWLSLYARVTNPGCQAPMALSLFGPQNSGKSYIGKRITQVLLGDDEADSVQLNLGGEKNEFLREITGASVVASVGEMAGFTRGDLNKIKDFMTRTSDRMHYKYEGTFQQQRQWIVMMDGNRYEGLQRDDTGNRRFYPMFVAQMEDKHGQPNWLLNYTPDFSGFDEALWQMMAECHAWFAANGGLSGYDKYVRRVSDAVTAFNASEMARDRGTIKDEALEAHLIPILARIKPEFLEGTKNRGAWISTTLIFRLYARHAKRDINLRHLATKMSALGAESIQYRNVKGYLFRDCMDEKAYKALIYGIAEDDQRDAELELLSKMDMRDDESDGF